MLEYIREAWSRLTQDAIALRCTSDFMTYTFAHIGLSEVSTMDYSLGRGDDETPLRERSFLKAQSRLASVFEEVSGGAPDTVICGSGVVYTRNDKLMHGRKV